MTRKYIISGILVVTCGALLTGEAFLRHTPTKHDAAAGENSQQNPVISSAALGEASAILEEEGQGPVQEVLPSIGGPIAILQDGVVAVDPETGEQHWSYRLPGTEIAAGVTPLDTTNTDEDPTQRVVLTHTTPSLLGSRGRTVTLDVLTGESEFSAWHSVQDPPNDRVQLLTQDTWVVPRDNRTLEAFSLETGRSAWEYQAPQGCQIDMPTGDDTVSGVGTLQTQVVTAWHCPEQENAKTVSLDSTTGEHKWVDANLAGNREGAPRVWAMDATALAHNDPPHAAQAITDDEVGDYYRLLNEDGELHWQLWEDIDGLSDYVTEPVKAFSDPSDPPDVVVGHSDEIKYSLRLHIIGKLLDQGLLDPDDIYDEYWAEGSDGDPHLIENREGRMIGIQIIEQAIENNDRS